MIYCTKCGKELNDGTKFCNDCGQAVNANVQNQQTVQQYPQQIIITQAEQKTNGVGTAGFVLAIIGIFLSWIPIVGWILWGLGLLLSFIGLFFKPRGLAVAGFIISIIDLIILLVVVGAIVSAIGFDMPF